MFGPVLECSQPGTWERARMIAATGETNRAGWVELEQFPMGSSRAPQDSDRRSHVDQVERTALVRAPLRSPATLVVVSAPAGYGKSTLLEQ